jgi:cardiolipin synthase A/B
LHTGNDDARVTDVAPYSAPQFSSLKVLGDHVSHFSLLGGNTVRLLAGGDETYQAMLNAIRGAQRSIALQSYIFDNDLIGRKRRSSQSIDRCDRRQILPPAYRLRT